jgi:hypothetical protein
LETITLTADTHGRRQRRCELCCTRSLDDGKTAERRQSEGLSRCRFGLTGSSRVCRHQCQQEPMLWVSGLDDDPSATPSVPDDVRCFGDEAKHLLTREETWSKEFCVDVEQHHRVGGPNPVQYRLSAHDHVGDITVGRPNRNGITFDQLHRTGCRMSEFAGEASGTRSQVDECRRATP